VYTHTEKYNSKNKAVSFLPPQNKRLYTLYFILSMFWFFRTGLYPEQYPDAVCKVSAGTVQHDPPLLFNLNYDPGELNPLGTKESPYKEILETIDGVGVTE